MEDSEPLLLEDGAKPAAVTGDGSSSISAVLVLSTLVIAAGSLANGCALGFSSPAQDGIMKELGLSIAEYSVFGSISTIGGMLGAIISGKVADLIGRKHTIFLMQIFCILGWLAIIFAQVSESIPSDHYSIFNSIMLHLVANMLVHPPA